jgi:hypothetical protein
MRKSLTWAAAGTAVAAVAAISVASTANAATTAVKPTSLSITKSTGKIEAGGSVTISGTLRTGNTAVGSQGVWLDYVGRYGHLHHIIEGTTSNKTGEVQFTRHPTGTTTYELVFNGARGYTSAHSGRTTVVVAKLPTSLTLTAPTTPLDITAGTKETFTGTLDSGTTPLAGKRVDLFALNSKKHRIRDVGHGTTLATGAVAITTTPPAGTDYYALVYAGNWRYKAAVSAVDKVKVSKIPATLLATEAAGTKAGTETITGTLAAGTKDLGGKTVTLQYENGKGKWVTLRSHSTSEAAATLGTTTFTVSPSKATTYRLTFGGTPVYTRATSNTVIAG